MTEPAIRYRKLPGHRRGIVAGSSLWLGPDHLLLVKSLRIREEYKRYYFSDIKAIAITEASRFHISTRSLAIGTTWFLTLIFAAAGRVPWAPWLWLVAALLVVVWAYVSKRSSCRCRIYTAVSADELPSIYRRWNAEKFLAIVEPRIREVQGPLEADWVSKMEESPAAQFPLFPDSPAAASDTEATPIAEPPSSPPTLLTVANAGGTAGASRTRISDAFLVSLVGGAMLDLAQLLLPFQSAQWLLWLGFLFVAVIACAVLVQHFRRILASGLHRIAVARLAWSGIQIYLLPPLAAGIAAASRTHASRITELAGLPPYTQALLTVDAVINGILAVVGIVMVGRLNTPARSRGMFSTEI